MTNYEQQIIEQEFKTMTQAKFARKHGVLPSTLAGRIKTHPEKHVSELLYAAGAVNNGVKPHAYTWGGKEYTVRQLADIAGISKDRMYHRIKRSANSIEDAMANARPDRAYKLGRKSCKRTHRPPTSVEVPKLRTAEENKLAQMQEWRANGASDEQLKFRAKML